MAPIGDPTKVWEVMPPEDLPLPTPQTEPEYEQEEVEVPA